MANLLSWLGKTVKDVEKNVGNFIGGAERGVQRNIVNPVVRQAQQAPQQITRAVSQAPQQIVRSLPVINQVANINDSLTNAYKSLPKIQQQQVNQKLQQASNTIKPISQFAEGSNQSFLAGGGRDLTNLAALGTKISPLNLAVDALTHGQGTKMIDQASKNVKQTFFPEAGKKNSLSPTELKDYNNTMKAGRLVGSLQKAGSEQAALAALSGGAGNLATTGAEALPLGEGIVSQVIPRVAGGVASGASFGGLQAGLDGKSVPEAIKQAAGWGVAGGAGAAVLPLVPNLGNIPIIKSVPRALTGAGLGAVTAPLAGMTPLEGAAFGLLGGSEKPYVSSNVKTTKAVDNAVSGTLRKPNGQFNGSKAAERPVSKKSILPEIPQITEARAKQVELNNQRSALLQQGFPENHPALKANDRAFQDITNQIQSMKQGGYISLGRKEVPKPIEMKSTVLNGTELKVTETPKTTNVELNTKRLDIAPEEAAKIQAKTATVVDTMSNKEVQELAKTAGLDTRTYTPEQTRKKIAEQLNLRQETVTLANQAKAARLAGNTDEAARLIQQAAERGGISRSQGTDLGRQLAARRIIADELASPEQRLFKLLDNAGVNPEEYSKRLATVDFNNANEVIKAYRDLVPAKFGDWLDVIRYNSMLSSPLTQIVNVSSTAGNIAMAPVERGITGTLDHFRSILTGSERTTVSGEGRAYAGGMIKGVKQGLQDFKDTLRGLDENLNVDVGQGGFVPVKAFGDSVTHDVLSFPGRLLGAFDNFHRAIVAGGSDAALTKRAAAGIKVGNIAAEDAAEAAYRTFNSELGNSSQGYLLRGIDEMTGLVMKARSSKNPVVKWPAKLTLPFVRIGSNLLKQGIEYGPAGIATIAGAENKTAQLSKAIMGTAVFGAAGSLIGHNRLTWAEPTDQKQKAAFREAGMQPYSVKIGNNWIGFAKLPPIISFNFALAAALDDAVKTSKINENGVDNVINAVAKYGNFLADQSYVKNVGDMLAAVKGDAESITRLVGNYPQQFVPERAFVGWLAKMSDGTQRMINSNASFADKQVENLFQQIPGLRQTTTARTDTAGNPLASQHPFLNAFSPTPVSTENPDGKAAFNIMQDRLQANKDQAALTKQAKEAYKSGDSSGLTDKQKKSADKQIKEDEIKKGLSPVERQLWDYSNQELKDMTGKNAEAAQKVLSLKSTTSTASNPKDRYQQALDKYNQDKKDGKISDVKDVSEQSKLTRLKAQSNFSQDANDLYSQSFKNIVSFVNSNKNGAKLWEEVKSLDRAMTDAGYTSKLYNKNGSLKATVAKSSGRKSTGAKKGRKATKGKVAKLPNFKIIGKPVAYKKVGAPKAKLPVSKLPKIKINKLVA